MKRLRNVSRFSASSVKTIDTYSRNALFRTASDSQKSNLLSVASNWHRPTFNMDTLEEQVLKYDCNLPPRCLDGDYLAILKKTMDEFAPAERIIPLTNGAALKHPSFPRDTSAGMPYKYEDGIRSKGDVIDKYGSSTVARIWQRIGSKKPTTLPDCLCFNRVIASEKTKTKIRPVWGYPFDVFAEEARWFYPLFSHLKETSNANDLCYGIGMETALGGHAHLRRVFASIPGARVLNADFSNFDCRVPAWMIRDVISYMSDWFDFSKVRDSDDKIWNVNPDKSNLRWKAMWSYFINTKVRLPNGHKYQKSHGVPSGSAFTNVIDTLCNAVAMRTALYKHCGLPAKDYYYGDDSTLFLSQDNVLDLEKLAEVLHQFFGFELHPDKTLLSDNIDNIHWLGYYSRPEGPRRSAEFILASTYFPDREVSSPIDSAARLLGQLYSCMDPIHAVWFYDAVRDICDSYQVSNEQLNDHISGMSLKSMKYLVTLGLTVADITVPPVYTCQFGNFRRIDAVVPRASPRAGPRLNCLDLPQKVFAPECYANPHTRLRPTSLLNFYECSFASHDDYLATSESDSGYETA
jgi:hypothetical protein